jgi:hypothetical protein
MNPLTRRGFQINLEATSEVAIVEIGTEDVLGFFIADTALITGLIGFELGYLFPLFVRRGAGD